MRTKHGANKLTKQLLQSGISAAAIHGNKSQGARTKALSNFKTNDIRVLVATDIAARGLDIPLLPHVVNFELPNIPEDYVHRIGRTGRAGASGEAISLVCSEETEYQREIEKLLGKKLATEIIEGYEPTDNAPPKRAATQSKGSFKKSSSKRPHRKNHTPRDARSSNSEGRSKRNSRNRRR
jgi:ATP-dependent RNA helicase RhlE